MLHLEDITGENWRIPLAVTKEQEKFVSNPMRLLARAYIYRNQGSYACMIYNDDEPIGMALYYEYLTLSTLHSVFSIGITKMSRKIYNNRDKCKDD